MINTSITSSVVTAVGVAYTVATVATVQVGNIRVVAMIQKLLMVVAYITSSIVTAVGVACTVAMVATVQVGNIRLVVMIRIFHVK